MHILISDYSGHPFQVQLSRELARRGHRVTHLHFAGVQTPKGNLTVQPGDPDGFVVEAITLDRPFAKATFVARWLQENEVGRRIAARIAQLRPDVVISSNAPLDTQRHIQRAARKIGARFVFWLQDIYSRAIGAVVPQKIPVAGHAIAAWYKHLEFAMLRMSDRVVAITEDFRPILTRAGIAASRIAVIENWAPLDEIPPMPRDSAWAQAYYGQDGLRSSIRARWVTSIIRTGCWRWRSAFPQRGSASPRKAKWPIGWQQTLQQRVWPIFRCGPGCRLPICPPCWAGPT